MLTSDAEPGWQTSAQLQRHLLTGVLMITQPSINHSHCHQRMCLLCFDQKLLNRALPFGRGRGVTLTLTCQPYFCRAYTLPQRYTYALDPQRLAALEAPQGMVSVRLVEAKDVPRMDLVGKTDCFCKRAPALAPERRSADHCIRCMSVCAMSPGSCVLWGRVKCTTSWLWAILGQCAPLRYYLPFLRL